MQVGVTPITLEDNHMGARGSLPGEPPSQQLQDRVLGPVEWGTGKAFGLYSC